MVNEWKSNLIGIISIAVSIFAFVNKEYRLFTSIILTSAVVFYIINSFSNEIDIHEEKLKRLEEKLLIHDQMTGMKSDIEYLKMNLKKR